ncbi:MAG TPA: 16S rRNA (cytosine(1402)-N(4))-methyltransferase RsmH [Candidatus Kapabacteria bacterium]
MKTERDYHRPVLLREAMEYLDVKEGSVYIDATLGGGGYADAMLERGAVVFGFDTDPAAQEFASKRLAKYGERFHLVKENFADLEKLPLLLKAGEKESPLFKAGEKESPLLFKEGARGWLSGIVYDLGVSSHQLDTTSIGLSYRVDAPLDMRLDPRLQVSAQEVIETYDESQLRTVFREFGEEPFAGRIARNIVRARGVQPIATTAQLAQVVASAVREDKKYETLSRVFQALRIEVNRELENLRVSLAQALEQMAPGGRIVVVSYHSLEDRIVKEFFKRESEPEFEAGSVGALKERIDRSKARLKLLTKKAIVPSEEEILQNPRARSAKLRAAEKIQ